jgi:hypothetical protein
MALYYAASSCGRSLDYQATSPSYLQQAAADQRTRYPAWYGTCRWYRLGTGFLSLSTDVNGAEEDLMRCC